MRVLVVTKIFPNALEPSSSPFNRQQIAALGRLAEVDVLATVPWFPGAGAFADRSAAGRLAALPDEETIDGLRVRHPRFLYVPKVHVASGVLYAASVLPAAVAYRGKVDVVLGTWAYPDGFAATLLARAIGVPSVLKLHGSDINVLGALPTLRPQIRAALRSADRVVAVSAALADAAIRLGAAEAKVDVVMNGVDKSLFFPGDRGEARRALGLSEDGKIVVYVGRVERAKGAVDLANAFARLAPRVPDARLVVVGDGGARAECEAIVSAVKSRVTFAGSRPHAEVPSWVRAADVLSLPSWNEGTPNAVLEALATGRRVVATEVGGIPALLADRRLGTLVPARDPASLASALADALRTPYDPADVLRISGCTTWQESAGRLRDSLLRALGGESRARAIRAKSNGSVQAAEEGARA